MAELWEADKESTENKLYFILVEILNTLSELVKQNEMLDEKLNIIIQESREI